MGDKMHWHYSKNDPDCRVAYHRLDTEMKKQLTRMRQQDLAFQKAMLKAHPDRHAPIPSEFRDPIVAEREGFERLARENAEREARLNAEYAGIESMAQAMEWCARKYMVPIDKMIGYTRGLRLSEAREKFVEIARFKLERTTPQIASFLKRDPSTIQDYVRRIERRRRNAC